MYLEKTYFSGVFQSIAAGLRALRALHVYRILGQHLAHATHSSITFKGIKPYGLVCAVSARSESKFKESLSR